MLELHEKQNLNYDGTIVDIETIGDYEKGFPQYDSREFNKIKVVIFGYINKNGLNIYCAEGIKDISNLEINIRPIINDISKVRPLYALNCHHEMGVIFHHLGMQLIFDKELQCRDYESKEEALQLMGINDHFNDPFQGKVKPGLECKEAWEYDQYDLSIKHNRACLLKEQALMLKGRGIPIIPFKFNTDVSNKPIQNAYQPWDYQQNTRLKETWNAKNTIIKTSQLLGRTPKSIFMQLQKLGLLPYGIIYDIKYNNATIINWKDIK